MPKPFSLTLTLETVTPLFLGGADPRGAPVSFAARGYHSANAGAAAAGRAGGRSGATKPATSAGCGKSLAV